MQMAKTVIALDALAEARVPVVVVLAHPTTGGVWASFASLGDVTYAEPGALIAFSGPRVIEETTREVLPSDFGRAERQLANGQVDAVVDRRELAQRIGRILHILSRPDVDPTAGTAPAGLQWAQGGAQKVKSMMDRIRPGSTDGEDAG
jgi:acetyl-CoA carboxylase carboxyl transferase subunit beta